MSDDLDSFFSDIEAHQASTEKMRKLDSGGGWQLAPAWGTPKDGKIVRPFVSWRPSSEFWQEQSEIMHVKQAKEAAEFAEQREQSLRREKSSAGRKEIEVSFGADKGNPANEESRSSHRSVDLVVE